MQNYPYTVENGSGEALTFLGVVPDQDGDRLEAGSRARPGAGPPMHVHNLQEEAMTVVSGTLGFQIVGEPPRYAGPGETVIFAPGVGHRWWNAGTTDLCCTGWAKPPHNVEYFLSALFDSMKRSGRNRPSLFDAAFLLTRYRSEMGMLAIPAVVQKVAFPLLLAIGTLLGSTTNSKMHQSRSWDPTRDLVMLRVRSNSACTRRRADANGARSAGDAQALI